MPHTRLVAKLLATTAVTNLIGSAIYPITARQGAALPYITHQLISDNSVNHSTGATETNHCSIQVDCWAAAYDGARALGAAVKTALKSWSDQTGDPAVRCHYASGSDAAEPVIAGQDTGRYRFRITLTLWYNANP